MKKAQPDPLSREALRRFDDLFGLHPGFRPVHAKGTLLSGTFTPSSSAKALTKAPHVNRPSIRVAVRFSDFAGIPTIPDYDENASPRGLALRFYLAEHVHTDIIGHSVDAFPTRTIEEFLEFLRAAGSSGPGAPKPTPIDSFLAAHPAGPNCPRRDQNAHPGASGCGRRRGRRFYRPVARRAPSAGIRQPGAERRGTGRGDGPAPNHFRSHSPRGWHRVIRRPASRSQGQRISRERPATSVRHRLARVDEEEGSPRSELRRRPAPPSAKRNAR